MSPWVGIVGRSSDGKHRAVEALKEAFHARRGHLGGFAQHAIGVIEDSPRRSASGYDLVALEGGARVPLARLSREPELCSLRFEPGAFEVARGWALRSEADAVVIEAGPLEAREQGHWPTILACLEEGRRLVILCIRRHTLASIALRLPDPIDALELPAEEEELRDFAERVARAAEARAGRPR